MYLNNDMFKDGICNGTIGVVTRLIDYENVEVTFPTFNSITKPNSNRVQPRLRLVRTYDPDSQQKTVRSLSLMSASPGLEVMDERHRG